MQIGALCAAFEPPDAFAVSLDQAHLTGQASSAQSQHGTWVVLGGGVLVELDGLGSVDTRSPAVFVAESGAVHGLGVAVFRGGEEQWERAIEIWFAGVEQARSVAVSEVVLGKRI